MIYDILNLSYRLKSKYGNNTEEIDSKMKKFWRIFLKDFNSKDEGDQSHSLAKLREQHYDDII